MATKFCASCRNGENEVEADYLVKGRHWVDDDRSVPYRAYLCKEHLEMMLEDGDDLDIVEYVGEALERRKNELTRKHTGYGSFAELCLNSPTLRVSDCMSREDQREILDLRKWFRQATGRKPAV